MLILPRLVSWICFFQIFRDALSSNVKIHKAVLARCNASNFKNLTSDLMMVEFGRDTLIGSSLTWAKNSKGESKPPLDKEKVEAIICKFCFLFPFFMLLFVSWGSWWAYIPWRVICHSSSDICPQFQNASFSFLAPFQFCLLFLYDDSRYGIQNICTEFKND